MKKSLLSIFLFMFLNVCFSQRMTEIEFKQDLSFIYQAFKKSASYKTQKNRRKQVEEVYKQLINSPPQETEIIASFEKFYLLLDEVKDYHNSIFSNSKVYQYTDLNNPEKVDTILFKSKDYFRKSSLDLDSLEEVLKDKPVNDLEGIYYLGDKLKVALTRTNDKLTGIILESKLPTWKRSEEILYLILLENDLSRAVRIKPRNNSKETYLFDNINKNTIKKVEEDLIKIILGLNKNTQKGVEGNDRFRMISGSFLEKRLISSIEGFKGGVLRSSGWRKENADKVFQITYKDTVKYAFKKINDGIDYIKVSTFGTSNKNIKDAMDFYGSLKEREFEKNIILDLSTNRGGGIRNSKHLYKILKAHKGKIYIIASYHTVSHAEQFILRMKQLQNVQVLGERTSGMLTYGSNYGTILKTPSGRFNFMFTDLKDDWKENLNYEGIGVDPDLYLSNDTDWIDQAVQIIKSDN